MSLQLGRLSRKRKRTVRATIEVLMCIEYPETGVTHVDLMSSKSGEEDKTSASAACPSFCCYYCSLCLGVRRL
jgi:hypothetical protein